MTRALTPAEIVAAMKRFGIRYRETPGWKTRSNGRAWGDVTGFMWHHTGDDAPDATDLKVVTYGRPGLSGPLCNFGIDDAGTVYLVAAGPANHAGGGDSRVLAAVKAESYTTAPPAPRFSHADYSAGKVGAVLGNPLFYGVECFYYRVQTANMLAAMPRLAAAIIDALDRVDAANSWSAKSGIGHLEWQRGKIDPKMPAGQSCATLRAATQAWLTPPPVAQEDDPMHVLVQMKGKPEVWASNGIHRYHLPNPAALAQQQALMKARGLPTAVMQVTSLDAFGVPVK